MCSKGNPLCGKGKVIRVEFVGDNLGNVVGVYNVGCVGCWWRREDALVKKLNCLGNRHAPCGTPLRRVIGGPMR